MRAQLLSPILLDPIDLGQPTVAALPSFDKRYQGQWAIQPPYAFLLAMNRRHAELGAVLSAIRELGKLGSNWDGYNALSISHSVVENVERFLAGLNLMTPMPTVLPNPNGTVSLQWEDGNRFAHLEIGKTRFSFYGLRGEERVGAVDGEVNSFGNDIEGTVQSLFCVDKTPSTQITELDYGYPIWAHAA